MGWICGKRGEGVKIYKWEDEGGRTRFDRFERRDSAQRNLTKWSTSSFQLFLFSEEIQNSIIVISTNSSRTNTFSRSNEDWFYWSNSTALIVGMILDNSILAFSNTSMSILFDGFKTSFCVGVLNFCRGGRGKEDRKRWEKRVRKRENEREIQKSESAMERRERERKKKKWRQRMKPAVRGGKWNQGRDMKKFLPFFVTEIFGEMR